MTTPTPRQLETVREILGRRASALADLRAMARHKAGSEWESDRIAEVDSHNRQLAMLAGRLGVEPIELVERAEAEALALSN